MTTQTTTIEASKPGARALIGTTVATVVVLGGALLWQARPASETAAPITSAPISSSTLDEGVAPLDGLAQQSRERQQTAAAAAAARVPVLDPAAFSDAEMYQRWRAVQVVAVPEPASQQQADRFADEGARMRALGGSDTPYHTSTLSSCGTLAGDRSC